MSVFWENIKIELSHKGITPTDLARSTNTPETTMIGWIRNKRMPPADKALEIADYLKVDLRYLLTGSGKEMSKERARWLAWIDGCTDIELEKSRAVLKFANEFLGKLDKIYQSGETDVNLHYVAEEPEEYNK